MASYNGEKYIIEQLNSIYNQTLKVDELIIVDDKSNDKTVELINDFIDTHKTLNVRFFCNEKNLGYRKNFLKAMSLCSGDYIFLCDQDDIWLEDKVKDMVDLVKQRSDIKVLASSFNVIDSESKLVEVKKIPGMSNNNLYTKEVEQDALVKVTLEEYMTHNYFQGCSLVIKKEIKDEVISNFCDSIPHDWFINMISAKYDGMYFWNKPYFLYRIHGKNTVGVPALNATKFQRLMETNTLYIRIQLAQDGLGVLDALKNSSPEFYNRRLDYYEGLRKFYENHILYLKKKKLFKLIMQNASPYYGQLKTRNARIMDILFIIMHKFEKE